MHHDFALESASGLGADDLRFGLRWSSDWRVYFGLALPSIHPGVYETRNSCGESIAMIILADPGTFLHVRKKGLIRDRGELGESSISSVRLAFRGGMVSRYEVWVTVTVEEPPFVSLSDIPQLQNHVGFV